MFRHTPRKTAVARLFQAVILCALVTGLIAFPGVPLHTAQAEATQSATALVLVNSTSADYADFTHYIQPYLDHFGVPYTVLDISTAPVPSTLNYAAIVIGHRSLDTAGALLDTTEQGYITAAVNGGVGLVNFDNNLSADGSTGRYAFINDVFTFGYNGVVSGSGVTFGNPASNYIIQNHTNGQTITTGQMKLAGITLPGDVTALAASGSQPFLAVTTYGAGRAVQFGSYDWISFAVKGPLYGLDDLFWRSIVWAARKPFVMQGLPPFVTMRMDDTSGPLWWIHTASDNGFVPWAGIFTNDIDATEAADLSALVLGGKATTTIHAFNNDLGRFFYFDHNNKQNFSDSVMAANYAEATAWFNDRNIPIGKYVTPHYYEIGSNAFGGLQTWGTTYISTTMDPGQPETADLPAVTQWMQAGPFRKYETGPMDAGETVYYADYVTIPGHPELNNKFFNCITEVRDITGYEWLGYGRTGVQTAIADGTEWLKRPLDSMAIATLFSHEYTFISGMSQSDWNTILQGIRSNITDAGYNPEFVSMDYACAYARAVHDSDISSAAYDPADKKVYVDFTGAAEIATRYYVFTEENGNIIGRMAPVSAFSGTNSANYYTQPGVLDHITVSPGSANVLTGATQQFTAQGYDADNYPIYGLPITWSVSGGGTINPAGLYTAGESTGSVTVTATSGTISGTATVQVVDTVPPAVQWVNPAGGANGIAPNAVVSARFNKAMDAATITTATFTLKDPSNTPVPATVSYNAATHTASLTPGSALAYNTLYTATITGGDAGVKDTNANAMAADYTWSFTTQGVPPDVGPGGPILVIASGANPFSRYYGEILLSEGLNEYYVTDITHVNSTLLQNYQVVILGEMALDTSQVTLLSDWVTAGGNLIAMRPDADLASLLGLTSAGGSLSNAYLKVDTSSGPGVGIVSETIQFHGAADRYTASGATVLATLYSDATTPTSYPAVTLIQVGANGGHAAAFTYDLARSVVYTRQGNPAWAGDERDGETPIRSDDLFYGAKSGDIQPDWVNLSKVAIPQADEQQRLLANMILAMNLDQAPLPRFWYLPRGERAAVVLTSDDHNSTNIPATLEYFKGISAAGCSVDDWECVRSSFYLSSNSLLSSAEALSYSAEGFDIGAHIDTSCENFTPASLISAYTTQLQAFAEKFPGLAAPVSERTHCVVWSDWDSQPLVKAQNSIRLDTDYYYWPPEWILDRPGFFTGSGMPQRFASSDGTLIDVYQAPTQMTDESGQTYPYTIDTLLDRAVGSEGYYGVFTANNHTDSGVPGNLSDLIRSAQARGVPLISARQLATWLDGRNASSFGAITWDSGQLSFSVVRAAGANGLRGMLPRFSASGPLLSLYRDGSPVSYAIETIKGVQYAAFDALSGSYQASYGADTTPPVISNRAAATTYDTATLTWTTNEPATSRVDYGTSPDSLNLNISNAAYTLDHSLQLTGLLPNTTYYYRVSSTDESSNTAADPNPPDSPASFTTPVKPLGDDLASEFGAGQSSCAYVAQMVDGELILPPLVGAEFSGSALPEGWTSSLWPGGDGSVTVGGGSVQLDEALLATEAAYTAGRVLDFVATLQPNVLNHAGFAIDFDADLNWAAFSMGSSPGSAIIARTAVNGMPTETITSKLAGVPHHFRIVWGEASVVYYIDDMLTPVASHTAAFTEPLKLAFSDLTIGAADHTKKLALDWARLSPYASPCTFTSQVFDAGEAVYWKSLTWTSSSPSGLAFSYRFGDSATPDGSWSQWVAVPASGLPISGRGRYAQYSVVLATADPGITPDVQDVFFSFETVPDTTGPVITARDPAPDAVEVPRTQAITITFDEVLDPATVTSASVYLRKQGSTQNVAATLTLAGNVVGLAPSSPLDVGTDYNVTVTSTVADLLGNPTAPATWKFTTGLAVLVDSSLADFSAGSGTCQVTDTGGGEVRLAPVADYAFDGAGLPDGWAWQQWDNGTATVSGGQLVVNGADAGTTAAYSSGRVLEFTATFTADTFQHVGFTDSINFNGPWVIFSTYDTTTTLYARSPAGDTAISGSYLNAPHLYRIEWETNTIRFYIDGVLAATHNATITDPLVLIASDVNNDSNSLSVDWMRMTPSPYTSPCTFTSRVLDAGQTVDWTELTYTQVTQPAGTSVAFQTQSSTDGSSWSAWQDVNSPVASPNGRYIRYKVTLSTTDDAQTPVLESVTINYRLIPTAANLNYFKASKDPAGVLLSWETVSEAATAGFNLYRREPGGEFVQLNSSLIPPLAFGQPLGAAYTYLDLSAEAGKSYEYKLEVISNQLQVSAAVLTTYLPYSISLPIIRH